MSILHHLIVMLSADTKDFQKDMKESSKQADEFTDKTKKSAGETGKFTSTLKTLAVGAGVAGAALATAKKVFEMGKEGAQLEFVRGKFDRLAESIGTTSDVLLQDLRAATKGTRSDMELIGSATDFLSLGLAKTRDEAVRLTRVAGALNMDMNQLVLTLANKTTMRFDQLGVSVDGFEERVKSLEESGYDVNRAFTEAFLQQAEAQILLVGDAADTSAGKIMQMEARVANLSDTFKVRLAPAVVGAIDWLDLFLDTWEDTDRVVAQGEVTYRRAALAVQAVEKEHARHIETLHRFDTEIVRSEQAVNNWRDEGQRAVSVLDAQVSAAARAAASFDNHKKAIRIAGKAAEESEPQFASLVEILNADVASPIAAFRKDVQWWMAGGDQLNQAFADIKEDVLSGAITPSEADQYLGELEIAAIDLNEELGNISATEAAEQISEDFHVSFKEAKQWLEGTEGPVQALEALTTKKWYVDIYYRHHGSPTSPSGGGSSDDDEYDGKRQHGGPVQANQPYLVGEAGPEVIWPGRSGYVSPVRDGGAGSGYNEININQTIYPAPGINEMALASRVARRTELALRAGAGYVGQ